MAKIIKFYTRQISFTKKSIFYPVGLQKKQVYKNFYILCIDADLPYSLQNKSKSIFALNFYPIWNITSQTSYYNSFRKEIMFNT